MPRETRRTLVIRGHRLEEIVEAGLAPSVRWLQDQIRAGHIPARKIGRHWVLTDDDLERALESWASTRIAPQQGITSTFSFSPCPTSMRRRSA